MARANSHIAPHRAFHGMERARTMNQAEVESLLYGAALPDLKKQERMEALEMSAGAMEARQHIETARKKLLPNGEVRNMTVSLYTSTASGKKEIVVQTNAQSLDLFISGLADAVAEALPKITEGGDVTGTLAALFRNAFPVAFAIAGYKAEKVVESRTLSCGAATPEKSSLLAHSRT